MAEKMRAMTSHCDGHGHNDDDDNDNEGTHSNEVRWEYSIDYCNASGFASSKFESLRTKRHRRGDPGGGGVGLPRFRFADVGGGVIGATTAINLNGIHHGGSSLVGGAATTTTTNNVAASAAESFLLTHDSGKENLDSGCGNESPTTSAAAKMKFSIPFPNDNNDTKDAYTTYSSSTPSAMNKSPKKQKNRVAKKMLSYCKTNDSDLQSDEDGDDASKKRRF